MGQGCLSESLRQELREFWKSPLLWDYPLSRLTSLRIGGPAEVVLFPQETEELQKGLAWVRTAGLPWWVIGRGTNVLAPDDGLSGVIFVLGARFGRIETVYSAEAGAFVQVQAGCSLPRLVAWCMENELSGLEFACGIPGSVGGGIRTNAGAWGKEVGDVIARVIFLDQGGTLINADRDSLSFSYRCWQAPPEVVVVAGVFMLVSRPRTAIESTCQDLKRRRLSSQPQQVASAGSFFRNPCKEVSAGELIDKAGLKGLRVGGAMVSEQHANFLVNTGTAKARDVLILMEIVQDKVQAFAGIGLKPEVCILGGKNGDLLLP